MPRGRRRLIERARSRYRIQQVRDALVDLDEATEIAVSLDDVVLETHGLVERTTALDWGEDFPIENMSGAGPTQA